MTAPMTSREALHPTQMSNQELAGALDDYRRWTVLEETTQDLLNAASQRLRAVAQTLPPTPHVEYVASRGQSKVEYWVSREEGGRIRDAHRLSIMREANEFPGSLVTSMDRDSIMPAACSGCANTGWCHANNKCYLKGTAMTSNQREGK